MCVWSQFGQIYRLFGDPDRHRGQSYSIQSYNGLEGAEFLAEVPQQVENSDSAGWWIINVDDASRQTGIGVGLQLEAPTGERIEQVI